MDANQKLIRVDSRPFAVENLLSNVRFFIVAFRSAKETQSRLSRSEKRLSVRFTASDRKATLIFHMILTEVDNGRVFDAKLSPPTVTILLRNFRFFRGQKRIVNDHEKTNETKTRRGVRRTDLSGWNDCHLIRSQGHLQSVVLINFKCVAHSISVSLFEIA